ncbi:MAG TPA: hypothetical protein VKZ60_08095 [Chloroflexota bacterium]|nr:hypothetical protein [Chloroflexota bacterium]
MVRTLVALLVGGLLVAGLATGPGARVVAQSEDAPEAGAARGPETTLPPTAIPSRPGVADDPTAPTPEPLPTVPAAAAPPSTTLVVIDRPAEGATMPQRFTATGWAADLDGPGTGVDQVHVYLGGEAGRGYFLGAAHYGEERPDVGRQLGHIRYSLAGWSLTVEVPPGEQTLYVYAHRRGTETWSAPTTVTFTVVPANEMPTAVRGLPAPGGCSRAPDGSCLPQVSGVAPTCPVVGPDGQCIAGARPPAPGLVGQPAGGPGPCLQRDAAGRCLVPATATAEPAPVLRLELDIGTAQLRWTPIQGATTYEVLRCNTGGGGTCTSVAMVVGSTYQVPRSGGSWYVVQARAANGDIIATSNSVGPF